MQTAHIPFARNSAARHARRVYRMNRADGTPRDLSRIFALRASRFLLCTLPTR